MSKQGHHLGQRITRVQLEQRQDDRKQARKTARRSRRVNSQGSR